MSSFQHTAEPWTLLSATPAHLDPKKLTSLHAEIQIGETVYRIAVPVDMPLEEFRANVQLMAASPTLLAALREIKQTCTSNDGKHAVTLDTEKSIAVRMIADRATETARPI